MECPSCRSTDLQKLSFIYNAGLFDVKGHSAGILGGGFYLHHGTRQSRLSQIASPPRKRSYFRALLLYGLLFYLAGALISLAVQPRQTSNVSVQVGLRRASAIQERSST